MTVSPDIPADLADLLEREVKESEQQPGEETLGQLAYRLGKEPEQLRSILRKLIEQGKVTKRHPGRVVYYRMVGKG